jgi:hypothetical protein
MVPEEPGEGPAAVFDAFSRTPTPWKKTRRQFRQPENLELSAPGSRKVAAHHRLKEDEETIMTLNSRTQNFQELLSAVRTLMKDRVELEKRIGDTQLDRDQIHKMEEKFSTMSKENASLKGLRRQHCDELEQLCKTLSSESEKHRSGLEKLPSEFSTHL